MLRAGDWQLLARLPYGLGSSTQDAEDFLFAHDQELFAIDLDLSAGIFSEEDTVAIFHIKWEYLVFVVALAFAYGDYLTFLWLFLG